MIKKSLFLTGIATLMLTGCQMDDQGQQSIQRSANHDDQNNLYPLNVATDLMNNSYGYTRYQKQEVHQNGTQQAVPMIDRNRLADGITRLVLTNNNVEEAGVLVTDEYVLVAYDTDSADREVVADQVKRSALSIVPRYYEVIISDNHDHFDDIERFQGLTPTTSAVENTLEQTIQEMKAQPQGAYNEETDHNLEIMQQKQERLKNGHS